MSEIDLIKHYRIGMFTDIPVYLCREDGCWIGKQNEVQPSCTARQGAVCIGGGDGEHPAIVINDPVNCVAYYLKRNGITSRDVLKLARIPTRQYMIYCDGMQKTDWEKHYASWYTIWKTSFSFDRWIALCVGEFLLHMLADKYPQVATWRRKLKDNMPWASRQMINIPWGSYGGNGTDYFKIKRNKSRTRFSTVPLTLRVNVQ
jgi:hypothetical protein